MARPPQPRKQSTPRKTSKPQKAQIPQQSRAILDQAERTPSPPSQLWQNLTTVLVAIIAGSGAVGAAIAPHWLPPAQQFECVDARVKAISIVKDAPATMIPVPYTGAEEDQCHLNAVVQQYRDSIKPPK